MVITFSQLSQFEDSSSDIANFLYGMDFFHHFKFGLWAEIHFWIPLRTLIPFRILNDSVTAPFYVWRNFSNKGPTFQATSSLHMSSNVSLVTTALKTIYVRIDQIMDTLETPYTKTFPGFNGSIDVAYLINLWII